MTVRSGGQQGDLSSDTLATAGRLSLPTGRPGEHRGGKEHWARVAAMLLAPLRLQATRRHLGIFLRPCGRILYRHPRAQFWLGRTDRGRSPCKQNSGRRGRPYITQDRSLGFKATRGPGLGFRVQVQSRVSGQCDAFCDCLSTRGGVRHLQGSLNDTRHGGSQVKEAGKFLK